MKASHSIRAKDKVPVRQKACIKSPVVHSATIDGVVEKNVRDSAAGLSRVLEADSGPVIAFEQHLFVKTAE